MVKLLERFLNGMVEVLTFAPVILVHELKNNNLSKAWRKMHGVEPKKSDTEQVDDLLEEISEDPEKFGCRTVKPPSRRSFQRNMAERLFYSCGFESIYDHERMGFVIRYKGFMQFIPMEMVADGLDDSDIYEMLEKMKYDADMHEMSEETERINAIAKPVQIKHIGFIGGVGPHRHLKPEFFE